MVEIQQGQQEMSESMHGDISSTGTFALPSSGSGLQQPTMEPLSYPIIEQQFDYSDSKQLLHQMTRQQTLTGLQQKLTEQQKQLNQFQQHRALYVQQGNQMIGSSGMQGSSSLSSSLPLGGVLQQPTMANVSSKNSNMKNIQNMSSVHQQNIPVIRNNNYLRQGFIRQHNNLSSIQQQQYIQQRLLQSNNTLARNIQQSQQQLQQLQKQMMIMQQTLPTTSGFQQQTVIDEPKQLFQKQEDMPEASSTLLDSTTQIVNPNGEDWQEEVYQKVTAMKVLYLQDLNSLHQKVISKLQHQSQETRTQQSQTQFQQQMRMPQASSASLVSTANSFRGDRDEEVCRKIKDLYLQDLNDMHEKFVSKLKQMPIALQKEAKTQSQENQKNLQDSMESMQLE